MPADWWSPAATGLWSYRAHGLAVAGGRGHATTAGLGRAGVPHGRPGPGPFHAPYLTGRPIPDEPWLNRDYLRGFHSYLLRWFEPLLGRARATSGPLAALDPERAVPEVALLLGIVAEPEPLLDVLGDVPQTLCHGDAHIDNLLVRQGADGPEVVAIDWQMLGPGPIGADLGQLLCEVPESHGIRSGVEVERAVLRAYHEEITRCGAHLDPNTISLAQSADALLRQAHWLVLLLCLRLEELPPADEDGAQRSSMSSSGRCAPAACRGWRVRCGEPSRPLGAPVS